MIEARPVRLPSRTLGIIILGASAFPRYPRKRFDNESFKRSAEAFRRLIQAEKATILGEPAVLNLFDLDIGPSAIIRRIREFLKMRPDLTDILFYYCGHGGFLPDHAYYLALKGTEPDCEASTGLQMQSMRNDLSVPLLGKRVFLILDCCFSGAALKHWMATEIVHVIEKQTFKAFPKQGTGMITSSSQDKVAMAPPGEPYTMFTGALIDVISSGVAGKNEALSFRDVSDAVRVRIFDRYGGAAIAPQIHVPQQEEGDITSTPFFVNRAFAWAPTKEELEIWKHIVWQLRSPFDRTRLAALDNLEEHLLSTRSAALCEEITEHLKSVQQNDKFIIAKRCEEILAHLKPAPVPPPKPPNPVNIWIAALVKVKMFFAPWFDLNSWSYQRIALGGAAFGLIAEMMDQINLF